MGQAIRQAVRPIARSRAQGLTVVAIMALSVGSCVAIFAMVKAVLLADLGYRDPARLAILWHWRRCTGRLRRFDADFVALVRCTRE